MQKVIINQFGEKYLVPKEHAAKFNRRSELVIFAMDVEKAIAVVPDPTNLEKVLHETMEKIRRLNRRIPAGCAEVLR
jgi:hypothetical protein